MQPGSALPNGLIVELRAACQTQNLELERVMAQLNRLTAGDAIGDYYVWTGPGVSDPDLILDVFVLGERCMYNYEVTKKHTGESCVFYDCLRTMTLGRMHDQDPPYILLFAEEAGHGARLYGREEHYERMLRFRDGVIEARLRATTRKEGP